MKKNSFTILLITFSSYTQIVTAQAIDEVKKEKTKRFSMGVQTMAMNSPGAGYGSDIHEFGIGVYARYFTGKHLAISLQANSTKAFTTFFYDNGRNSQLNRNGFEVPIQLEYHLSPGGKVRSYIGAGAGIASYHTKVKPWDNNPSFTNYEQSPFVQLSYGIGFDAGKKMSVNTSLFYRYNLDSGQSTIGLSIGIGRKR